MKDRLPKMLNDNVLVELSEPENVTRGGIHLPDNAVKKTVYATVVAIGPGREDDHRVSRSPNYDEHGVTMIPHGVEVGDKVILSEYCGSNVMVGQKEYKIIRLTDIRAKL